MEVELDEDEDPGSTGVPVLDGIRRAYLKGARWEDVVDYVYDHADAVAEYLVSESGAWEE